MINPAELILSTLDRHLAGPTSIRLFGGAALILGYGLERATEDADLLLEHSELQLLVERSDFGHAIEATNNELESLGLYISHIWGPEQQILTPNWRNDCRALSKRPEWKWLDVSVLGPLDLIVGKLARADEEDLDDISFLIKHESLSRDEVCQAIRQAIAPEILKPTYVLSRAKLENQLKQWKL